MKLTVKTAAVISAAVMALSAGAFSAAAVENEGNVGETGASVSAAAMSTVTIGDGIAAYYNGVLLSSGDTVPVGAEIWIGADIENYVNHAVVINGNEFELVMTGDGYWYNNPYTVNSSSLNISFKEKEWSAARLSQYVTLNADRYVCVWYYNEYLGQIAGFPDRTINNFGGYIHKDCKICIRIPSSVYTEKPYVYINGKLVDCSLNYDGMWQIWAYDVPDDSDVLSIRINTEENPTDPSFDEAKVSEFVERLYVNLMGRASDPKGKADHVSRLKAGQSACDVAKGFVLSTELKGKKLSNKEFVTRMYKTMLNRNPDAAGLAKWTKVLDNGCSYGAILQGFCGASEFTNLCASYGVTRGTYKSNEYRDYNANLTAYVSRMYTVAMGRSYDVVGLNNHTRNYINGTKTAEGIAHDFIFSPEFKQKNLSNEEFVECMYNTLFGRKSDAAGKNKWLAQMRSGLSREGVFKGFTGSYEFDKMVKGFDIK